MTDEQLQKLAAEQQDGTPMPVDARMNAALWEIAVQLSRELEELREPHYETWKRRTERAADKIVALTLEVEELRRSTNTLMKAAVLEFCKGRRLNVSDMELLAIVSRVNKELRRERQ